jgi:hypothetical protein
MATPSLMAAFYLRSAGRVKAPRRAPPRPIHADYLGWRTRGLLDFGPRRLVAEVRAIFLAPVFFLVLAPRLFFLATAVFDTAVLFLAVPAVRFFAFRAGARRGFGAVVDDAARRVVRFVATSAVCG